MDRQTSSESLSLVGSEKSHDNLSVLFFVGLVMNIDFHGSAPFFAFAAGE